MKHYILIFFLIFSLVSNSQKIVSPKIDKKNNENIGILEIEKNANNTIIHFIYQSDDRFDNGGWINIHPEVKIKETNGYLSYSLLKAEGIPLSPEKKNCDFAGQYVSFRLIFPKIAYGIDKIDIIECSTSNCFNFYGVSLEDDSSSTNVSNSENERFRRDYNLVSIYDNDTEEWSDWNEGSNTFVINYNDNGDIAHYKPNGKMALYRKISGVEEDYTESGEHYQIITALDEDGLRFKFQFFDDPKIGLKLIYGDIMIQFAKH